MIGRGNKCGYERDRKAYVVNFELFFMIGDTLIYKTYIVKFVIYLISIT